MKEIADPQVRSCPYEELRTGGSFCEHGERMSKVRINELARELEVKSREILDALTAVGVTEKRPIRARSRSMRPSVYAPTSSEGAAPAAVRSARHEADTKPKIDWSRSTSPAISPTILERKQQEAHPAPRPPAPAVVTARPVVTPPAPAPAASAPAPARPTPSAAPPAPVAPIAAAPAPAEVKPAPRRIVPIPRQAPAIVAAPPAAAPPAPASSPLLRRKPRLSPRPRRVLVAKPPVANPTPAPVIPAPEGRPPCIWPRCCGQTSSSGTRGSIRLRALDVL